MSKNEKQRKADAKRAGTRTRNWTFIVYPESAPEDWRDRINADFVEWIESPLHDKDTDATGAPKKPHWHVLVMYPSVKTFEQVQELTERVSAPIPQMCASAKGLVRYMTHLDNPDKAQYSVNDIVCHGGADLADLMKPSSSERYGLIREMAQYIKDNAIIEYNELFYYAMENRFEDWFPLLCDSATYALNALIKSNRYGVEQLTKTIKVDGETGEVIEK